MTWGGLWAAALIYFVIENAVSIPQLEDAFRYGYWQHFVYPIDSVLLHWRAVVVSGAAEDVIKKGGAIVLENGGGVDYPELRQPTQPHAENYYRAYTLDGHLLAVLRFNPEMGRWHSCFFGRLRLNKLLKSLDSLLIKGYSSTVFRKGVLPAWRHIVLSAEPKRK